MVKMKKADLVQYWTKFEESEIPCAIIEYKMTPMLCKMARQHFAT